MNFWNALIIIVLGVILWLYINAKGKRTVIRCKALRDYIALRQLIENWDENRNDERLTENAIEAAAIHRQRSENCEFMCIKKISAEDFVYLKEYESLMHDDKFGIRLGPGIYILMSEATKFYTALSDLDRMRQS